MPRGRNTNVNQENNSIVTTHIAALQSFVEKRLGFLRFSCVLSTTRKGGKNLRSIERSIHHNSRHAGVFSRTSPFRAMLCLMPKQWEVSRSTNRFHQRDPLRSKQFNLCCVLGYCKFSSPGLPLLTDNAPNKNKKENKISLSLCWRQCAGCCANTKVVW